MKKFNWIAWWLLGCVTCGIYPLYVWYAMTKNNNEIAEKHNVKTIMGFIPAMLLGIITCGIYSIIWQYQFFDQQVKIAEASGVEPAPTSTPILMFILAFVPIYSFYFIADNHNRVVDANS